MMEQGLVLKPKKFVLLTGYDGSILDEGEKRHIVIRVKDIIMVEQVVAEGAEQDLYPPVIIYEQNNEQYNFAVENLSINQLRDLLNEQESEYKWSVPFYSGPPNTSFIYQSKGTGEESAGE